MIFIRYKDTKVGLNMYNKLELFDNNSSKFIGTISRFTIKDNCIIIFQQY